MRQVAFIILTATLLTACEATVRGPSVELDVPKLKVYDGSGFCPPGQAKKGNC